MLNPNRGRQGRPEFVALITAAAALTGLDAACRKEAIAPALPPVSSRSLEGADKRDNQEKFLQGAERLIKTIGACNECNDVVLSPSEFGVLRVGLANLARELFPETQDLPELSVSDTSTWTLYEQIIDRELLKSHKVFLFLQTPYQGAKGAGIEIAAFAFSLAPDVGSYSTTPFQSLITRDLSALPEIEVRMVREQKLLCSGPLALSKDSASLAGTVIQTAGARPFILLNPIGIERYCQTRRLNGLPTYQDSVREATLLNEGAHCVFEEIVGGSKWSNIGVSMGPTAADRYTGMQVNEAFSDYSEVCLSTNMAHSVEQVLKSENIQYALSRRLLNNAIAVFMRDHGSEYGERLSLRWEGGAAMFDRNAFIDVLAKNEKACTQLRKVTREVMGTVLDQMMEVIRLK